MKTITALVALALASVVHVTALPAPDSGLAESLEVPAVAGLPPPRPCGNQGLEWAYFNNTSGRNEDATYSNFLPEAYKGRTPIYTGVVNTIAGVYLQDGLVGPIYNSSRYLYTNNFVINHRGYVFAPQTGTYTFVINGVDDALMVWVGWPLSFAGWTRQNAYAVATYNQPRKSPGSATFRVQWEQGKYYGVRMVWANAQGPAVFALSVMAPDGSVFLGGNTAGSEYIVTRSCDNTAAPPYPAWAIEK